MIIKHFIAIIQPKLNMNEQPFDERILEQAKRLKKNFNQVDEEVFHKTFELVNKIFSLTGNILPKKKIKFLLTSTNNEIFMNRVTKLGKRFLVK